MIIELLTNTFHCGAIHIIMWIWFITYRLKCVICIFNQLNTISHSGSDEWQLRLRREKKLFLSNLCEETSGVIAPFTKKLHNASEISERKLIIWNIEQWVIFQLLLVGPEYLLSPVNVWVSVEAKLLKHSNPLGQFWSYTSLSSTL